MKRYLVVSITLFFSCVSTLHVKSIEKISKIVSPVTMAYLLDTESIKINIDWSVEKDLGRGDKKTIIGDYVGNDLRFGFRDSGLFSNVKRLRSIKLIRDTSLIVNSISTKFKIPQFTDTNLVKNDFLLIISDLAIDDKVRVSAAALGLIPIVGVARTLLFSCNFIIYNIVSEKIVYIAQIQSETKSDTPGIDLNTWQKAINEFAGKILKKTVFKRMFY